MVMENALRCNFIRCRKELDQHAVVTTCSHIFCLDCSGKLQLSNPPEGQKPICPACDTHLVNPDDAVIANLNPTEDYKTSVLSGLAPSVIMECAGRALNFWAYQKTQEIVYQDHVVRGLTNKYTDLNSEFERVIHVANSEVSDLRSKLESMTVDQDTLKRKNDDLRQAYEEKARKQLQAQEMYDKLKRKTLLGQVQNAASDAVEHTIEASISGDRSADCVGGQEQRGQQSMFVNGRQSNENSYGNRRRSDGLGISIPPTSNTFYAPNGSWNNIVPGNYRENDPSSTPSSHRQRLDSINPPNATRAYDVNHVRLPETPPIQRSTPRQPLAGITNLNSPRGNYAGYGMSARVKVSNPSASVQGFRQPAAAPPRGRIAQRPTPTSFLGARPPTFGPSTTFNNPQSRNSHSLR